MKTQDNFTQDQPIESFTAGGATFYKSSYSGMGGCVAVAWHEGGVRLADSKNPGLAPHEFTFDEWEVFVAGVKSGQFDRQPARQA